MGACCGSCASGGACEGGKPCGGEQKASAGLTPADLPHLRAAIDGTGSRPSWAPPKPSGYIDPALDPLGAWEREENERRNPVRGEGERMTLREFEEKLRELPAGEREAALREFMRGEGASDAATTRAVTALVGQGLQGLFGFLRSDTDRDIAEIRARAAVDQERARQEGETARAEVNARYGVNNTNNTNTNATGGGVSPLMWLALAAGAVGIAYGLSRAMAPQTGGL